MIDNGRARIVLCVDVDWRIAIRHRRETVLRRLIRAVARILFYK